MLDPILLAMMISDLLLTFLPDHQSDPLEVIFIPKKKKEKSNMKKQTNFWNWYYNTNLKQL